MIAMNDQYSAIAAVPGKNSYVKTARMKLQKTGRYPIYGAGKLPTHLPSARFSCTWSANRSITRSMDNGGYPCYGLCCSRAAGRVQVNANLTGRCG